MKTAKDIEVENLEAWGSGRDRFPVEVEDIRILIDSGGQIFSNQDNCDGTFSIVVKWNEHFYSATTTEQLR